MSANGPFLYPNVTSLPGSGQVSTPKDTNLKKPGQISEFDQVLDQQIIGSKKPDLTQVKDPLKFSAHATQRLQDRNIKFSPEMMAKVNDAVDKAAAKGVEESLILTGDAALIVSVKNRTVITALDKSQLGGNVFTNIDGAVII